MAVDGPAGSDRRLEIKSPPRPIPTAVTSDGLRVLFHAQDPSFSWGLYDGAIEVSGESRMLLTTPASETFAALSPDGNYIAYQFTGAVDLGTNTNGAGQGDASQIFVQPYPSAGDRRWSVSRGRSPHWTRDGRELLFVDGDTLMSVPSPPGLDRGKRLSAWVLPVDRCRI